LTFGTNLFHYMTYDAAYSHVFSFAAVAFVLWRTVRVAESPTAARALTLGLGIGLAATIRPTNLVIALFPLLVYVHPGRTRRVGSERSSVNARHEGDPRCSLAAIRRAA
jgi:hypothetical protein